MHFFSHRSHRACIIFISCICFCELSASQGTGVAPHCARVVNGTSTVLGGLAFVLCCDNAGSQPRSVIWTKDGQVLESDERHILDGYNVTVPQATAQNIGDYQCEVVNQQGIKNTQVIHVTLIGHYFQDIMPAVSKSRGEGMLLSCELACHPAENSRPGEVVSRHRATVRWDFEGNPLSTQHCYNLSSHDKSCHIMDRGRLTIYNLQPEDTGTYTCFMEFSFVQRDAVVSQSTHVHVKQAHVDIGTQLPTKVSVDQGERLELLCNGTGEPRPITTWLKNNEPLQGGRGITLSRDGMLLIESVQPERQGLYTCVVHNRYYTLKQKVSIVVKSLPKKLHVFVDIHSIKAINVTWQTYEPRNAYPISNFTLGIKKLQDSGFKFYTFHAAKNFVLVENIVEQNVLYQVVMWATNKLGSGENATVTFLTPPSFEAHAPTLHTGRTKQSTFTETMHKFLSDENVLPWVAVLVACFVLMFSALITVAVIAHCRSHRHSHSLRTIPHIRIRNDSEGSELTDLGTMEDGRNTPWAFINPAFQDDSGINIQCECSQGHGAESSLEDCSSPVKNDSASGYDSPDSPTSPIVTKSESPCTKCGGMTPQAQSVVAKNDAECAIQSFVPYEDEHQEYVDEDLMPQVYTGLTNPLYDSPLHDIATFET